MAGYAQLMHFDGEQWNLIFDESSWILSEISAASGDDIYVAGYGESTETILHWDGSAWAWLPVAIDGYRGLSAIQYFQPDDLIGTVWGAHVYKIHDFVGTEMITGPHDFIFESMWHSPSGQVYLAGTTLASPEGRIYKWTGESGLVELVGGMDYSVHSLWGISDTEIYFSGEGIWKYDGESLVPLLDPSEGSWNSIWGIDGNDIFAVGSSGDIVHWDGIQWEDMSYETLNRLLAVWGCAPDCFVAVGEGMILQYDGSVWKLVYEPDAVLNSVWGSGSDDIYAVGEGGIICHYDGDLWTSAVYPGLGNMQAIRGLSRDQIYILAYDFNKHVSSIVQGKWSAWNPVDMRHMFVFFDLWSSTENQIWVCGDSGSLAIWNSSGTQPTPTPYPTATPAIDSTPTPAYTPGNWVYSFDLNQDNYRAGDRFRLRRDIFNPGPDHEIFEIILLDVIGVYYFWPDWTTNLQGRTSTLPAGELTEIILEFDWPSGDFGSVTGLWFWGGCLDPHTASLLGNIDGVSFGYGL
jgi:hypothetical protein